MGQTLRFAFHTIHNKRSTRKSKIFHLPKDPVPKTQHCTLHLFLVLSFILKRQTMDKSLWRQLSWKWYMFIRILTETYVHDCAIMCEQSYFRWQSTLKFPYNVFPQMSHIKCNATTEVVTAVIQDDNFNRKNVLMRAKSAN